MPTVDEWKYACPVMFTKGELLQLVDLAGEESVTEYVAKIVREHIRQEGLPEHLAYKRLYEGKFE